MRQREEVQRTVQYYQLTDARTGVVPDDFDWWRMLHGWADRSLHSVVDGQPYMGDIRSVSVSEDWRESTNAVNPAHIQAPADEDTTYGIVLSKERDHVPNQRGPAGDQLPMGLEEGYAPVDNLFVWFLPFGNMIGVLQESVASARSGAFTEWLTRVMRDHGAFADDPDFRWGAKAVIDDERLHAIATADALKAVVVAGRTDRHSRVANGVSRLFGGPQLAPGAFRVEVKIRAVRGSATYQQDTANLRHWLDATLGDIDGQVIPSEEGDKVRAEIVPRGDDVPPGEIDLLQHRLTRKRTLMMRPGDVRAFMASAAIGAIIEAFVLDFDDLRRLV